VSLASLQIVTTILFFMYFNNDITITLKVTTFIIIANILILIMGYYRNLLETERSQKLVESETFLRLITDQLPVSVWITDVKLNRQATFGRIQNMNQLATIPNNTALKAYYQAIGGKSAQFEDYRDNRHFQYHVEPMRNEANKIIGTLGVATDITEQKISQQQSLQLELERERVDMLSQFIEHSSHDLRTPLSNINTYLYLLDKAVQTDKEHGYVQVIREQSNRLHELIDNMLTMQRLELESDSERTNVSLKSLLDEIETAVRSRIEAESLVFDYIAPECDATLQINKNHLHMALNKMIDNAIQFTLAPGSIRLSANCDDQSVTISLQDTGVGISQEKIPHIFELFYRGDDSRPTSTGDNGLGLAIANRIIKSHKGTIRVESVVDEGSTFYITLPKN
jgi:signal transduction histidine kinase